MGKADRNRAVVLGASMAGLLAARVLADTYRDVVVVDRDDLSEHECVVGEHVCPRRSIPQGQHVHALLARGRHIMEELLPGLTDELIAGGAVTGDVTGNVRWVMNGRGMPKPHSDMLLLSMSRPLLEQSVRARVRALPNVRFLEQHDIEKLLTDDNSTVIGAAVTANGRTYDLTADLVVDATGRRTRLPAWLKELGYPEVEQEELRIAVGYATQYYRLPQDAMPDEISIDVVAAADQPRGAICAKIDGGRALVTAYGMLGDYPPSDSEGFLAFLKTLSATDIYDTVADTAPMGPPVSYRFPANLRRRYERMASFPDGLLVLGDAVCSFNPVYGQGMTVAALGATVLRDHIGREGGPVGTEYLADLAGRAVDHVWDMTIGADLAFPGVEGERTPELLEEHAYVEQLLEAAVHDPSLLVAYARVVFLVDPPEALATPEIQAAVFAAAK